MSLRKRQVSVDAQDKDNRAEQSKVVATILDPSIGGGQTGELYERRWCGEVDIRPIKSTMKMGSQRCKSPEMGGKEVRVYYLANNPLRTVTAIAAAERASQDQFQRGQADADRLRAEVGGGGVPHLQANRIW